MSIFSDAIKFLINKYFLTNFIEKEDIVLSVKKNLEIEKYLDREKMDLEREKNIDPFEVIPRNDIPNLSDSEEIFGEDLQSKFQVQFILRVVHIHLLAKDMLELKKQ